MDAKKKSNWFFKILIVLFIAFLCLYSMSLNGYVDNMNKKKTLYTEEQIDAFERDVKNGEYLDYKEYTKVNEIDYSNRMSDLGVELSELISFTADKSIELFNQLFSYLFE